MELRRQKSNLQNKISDAETAKRIAEDPEESPSRRSQFRTKYENLQKEVANARKAVADLDKEVKAEQARKESLDIQANYDRLKGQYDLVIDKTTPEAQNLAEKVSAEVKKLNEANKTAGISRRFEPITTVQDIQ